MLTPSCVHVLNASHQEQLQGPDGHELLPVESKDETRDAAIVSEFAYHLARKAFEDNQSVTDAFGDASIRNAAQAEAYDLINQYEGRDVLSSSELNAAELDEGLQLALRYESFADKYGGAKSCAFQVPIRGCGFLQACSADLVIGGSYLVEIKTVKRTLAGKDIRQLVIYLALSSASDPSRWHWAGFFNPRLSTFHRFLVKDLVAFMSGGMSLVDVYTELISFTCSSDMQVDTGF